MNNTDYRLCTLSNVNTLTGIRELTNEEFEMYSQQIQKINKLFSHEDLIELVSLNFKEIEETFSEFSDNFHANDIHDHKHKIRHIYINLNRLLLNFLSSVRTFLDHLETNLKRDFGDSSKEVTMLKNLTSSAYDNYFSFRFLSHLRNYAQHCGLPSGHLENNLTFNNNGEQILLIKMLIDRDNLLSTYNWKPKIKSDLQKQDFTFDIFPLIQEKYRILNEINASLQFELFTNYETEAISLSELIAELKDIDGIPCLIKGKQISENQLDLESTWFPIHKINEILKVNL